MLKYDRSGGALSRWQQALVLLSLAVAMSFGATPAIADDDDQGDDNNNQGENNAQKIQWVNHFDLLPGGAEVTTTFNSTTSGPEVPGLTGLVIRSSTTGDTFSDNGNKVVQMALELQ